MSKHGHHFMRIKGCAWEVCISCGKRIARANPTKNGGSDD